MNEPPRPSSVSGVLRAVVVAIAAVACTMVLASAFRDYLEARYVHRTLRVTGASTRSVRSDLAIWSATVHVDATTIAAGYPQLASATTAVRDSLRAGGATDAEVRFTSIDTEERIETTYTRDPNGNILSETRTVVGYVLRRSVTVTSSDLAKVDRIANGITDLLERGLNIRSHQVEYIFSGLANLKIQLVEAATRDARQRAERVASASGAELGTLERADVGVFQVNAENQTATSWDGIYDRTSVGKDVMVTVRTVFALR